MPLSPLRSSMVGGGTPRHRHTGSKDITDDPFSDPYPARSPRLRHDHAFTHELHYNGAPGPRAGPSSPKFTSSPKSDVFTYGNQEEHLGPSPITNTYPPPSAFGLTEETSHQVPLPRPRPRFSESNPNARKSWYHSIIGAPQARNSRFSIYNPFGGGGAGGFRQSFFHGDDGATGTGTSRAVPGHFSRNASERGRLQGLMQWSSTPTKLRLGDGESEVTRETGWIGQNLRRLRIWMVNDGSRSIFYGVWILIQVLLFAFALLHYALKDNLSAARAVFGASYVCSRSAAMVLDVDLAFILLPICRNFISLLRRTPLGEVIPFDKNISFHKQIGYSIWAWSTVHTISHQANFYKLAKAQGTGVGGFFKYNFWTGPGLTGWIMTACLWLMVWFAMEKRKRANFERFWYTHHLFVLFFLCWQLHGMYCMIKPDRTEHCKASMYAVFWKYWLPGGLLFIAERILREVRANHKTTISKVVQHPSNVMEVQIRKEHATVRAGQYIFINCPEISYWQYHPFTLTSAPEEDYLSCHIRVEGDWTTAFAKVLGCDFQKKGGGYKGKSKDKAIDLGKSKDAVAVQTPLNRYLPRVMIDGPFGSASEDFNKFETVLLVGAGIGVTPFASILKSIWYRMNDFGRGEKTRLSKVYFVWVIRDFGSAEWFHSLLEAIEAEDTEQRIEIHIYLTAKITEDQMNNILLQDVGADKDAITSLRSPTHFGRPNWDRVFESIASKHPDTDCGVFFCGPPVLSKQLHLMCNTHTTPEGCRFFYGKENF
ncbi:NADPH oxidase isoform 2 [Filobasidium floriforme]|uniref:NADPH oxidase isoform 2 n=1 Tax=Filobasidium floriforme TaxID=5210 RepID=UPI001E8E1A6E|nr:NADPH oxidase isoform 2 [Filobasidium floriforme]KAH8080174.1 NADPH oxidase isoform 2 [Filobasidium floriforme]